MNNRDHMWRYRKTSALIFTLILGSVILNLTISGAHAASFFSFDSISISDNRAGSPYPAEIAVSGMTGLVTKVTVTLSEINHTNPDDIDILLVGPRGQNIILMSDAGGSSDITRTNVTFNDAAAGALPDSSFIASGTYKPSNYGSGDAFPSPAPTPSNANALSVFNFTDPNGTWRLYVVDDRAGDAGNIAGGWSLNITTSNSTVVANTNDGGEGSLRFAILNANALNGANTISFNIAGAGPHTISPATPLPAITDAVTIDGYTQPGSSPNTRNFDANDAQLRIEINGANAGASADGLTINAPNCRVRGLAINRFGGAGVKISGANVNNNQIDGNFIGTNVDGTSALPNNQGVVIRDRASNNTVGTLDLGEADAAANRPSPNLISGNRTDGIAILDPFTADNKVRGNFIGTNAAGAAAIPNQLGVRVDASATRSTIGGDRLDERNVISGNTDGITLKSGNTSVSGNYTGTNAAGTAALPNTSRGISINNNGSNNTIGGAGALANTIAFNGAQGIHIASGTGNLVAPNAIHSNGGLGLDLGTSGVTPNDTDDADTGPNNLQNFPVLTSALTSVGGTTTIEGTYHSKSPVLTSYVVRFYSNDSCDSSGNGEGQTFIGEKTGIGTNASGNASFTFTTTSAAPAGKFITATAADMNTKNTSEFSQCLAAQPLTTLEFSAATYEASEDGNAAAITVSRTEGNEGEVAVNYATIGGGTATAGASCGDGVDFINTSGTFTWADGDTADKTFNVALCNDSLVESAETIKLGLSNSTNTGRLGARKEATLNLADDDLSLIVTNLNDDGAGSLRQVIADANAHAGGSRISFASGLTGDIRLLTPLPVLEGIITINGPGAEKVGVRPNSAYSFPLIRIASGANVRISGLTLTFSGGAISNEGTLHISRLNISENFINTGSGGGILNASGATLTVTNSSIYDNFATTGAGLENQGTASITSSTISSNAADDFGGGIRNTGTLHLSRSTIHKNRMSLADRGSAGGIHNTGTLTMNNTILAGNSALSAPDLSGALDSEDYNLIGSTDGTTITGATAHNITNLDARLANLKFGVPLPFHIPEVDSPAIDAGSNTGAPTTDGRGQPRIGDGNGDGVAVSEIGAVELQKFTVTSKSNTGTGTLRKAIADANAVGGGVITFNSGLTGTISLATALDGLENIAILGPGAANLTIQRSTVTTTPEFSVFTVPLVGVARIVGLTLSNGKSTNAGGISNSGRLIVENCTLSGNTATSKGAALHTSGIEATVLNSTFSNNTSAAGAVIWQESNTLRLTGSTISSNTSTSTINSPANLAETYITRSAITGNTGRGINNAGKLELTDSTISGNKATGEGGGLLNGGTAAFTSSTISGNTASAAGGGIFNNGTINLTNCTVSGNRSSSDGGGGVFNNFNATVNLAHSTVTANIAPNGGGIMNNRTGGTVNMKGSILAGNTDNTNPFFHDGAGRLASQDYNLIGNTTGLSISGATVHNLTNVSARLRSLDTYGGATRTHSLLPDSPAIDAGTNDGAPATDQRGQTVVDGNGDGTAVRDIGAFERQNFVVRNLLDGGAGSLRQVITDANTNRSETITFAPGVRGVIELTSALPAIGVISPAGTASSGTITINGPGAANLTIRRSTEPGTPAFRIFHINGGATVNIAGLTISNGAGGMLNNGTLIVSDCIVTGNAATRGGGIQNSRVSNLPPAFLTLRNSTVSGNAATGTNAADGGGGIYTNDGVLTVSNSAIVNNTAAGGGGGIFNGGSGSTASAAITNSTISGNTADGNSTLDSVRIGGGGIFTSTFSSVKITSSTIAANTTAHTGGGIHHLQAPNGFLELNSSILAGNTANSAPDFSGNVNSKDYNLIGNPTGANITGATTHDITNADARLAALANNGGTTLTHALLEDSPAIDAGDDSVTGAPHNLTTDQRGLPRRAGDAVDIGAFESGNSPAVPAISVSDATVTEGDSGTTGIAFNVTLSAASASDIHVPFATADGSATAPADYTATSGTLTVPAGQTGGVINVAVTGDTSVENTETFFINLDSPANATLADNQGLGTITNDDADEQPVPSAPSATTEAATNVSARTATLNATVNAHDDAATVTFEYGKTTSYGFTSPKTATVTGSTDIPVSIPISGLSPATTYNFRVVAVNGIGTTNGENRTLTTRPLSPVLISEFRHSGPNGAADEFVEIYNNTDADLAVRDSVASEGGGWAVVSKAGTGAATALFTIPSGTVIRARSHYLAVAAGESGSYSLADYAAGETGYLPVADEAGIAIFNTAAPSHFNAECRLDAVGFASSESPYFEGAPLAAASLSGVQASFVRKSTNGFVQDTDDNAGDFLLVAIDGKATLAAAVLGAPGPENSQSHIVRNATIKSSLLAPTLSSSVAPNRVRTGTGNSGTVSFRRTLRNNTGQPLTSFRFRVNDLSTIGNEVNTASAQLALTDSVRFTYDPDNDPNTANTTVLSTTPEAPSATSPGGGINASLRVNLPQAIAPGAAFSVNITFNVLREGAYRFSLNHEALLQP